MSAKHMITVGFAAGGGLDLGSARFMITLGLGLDELSQQTTVSHNRVIKEAKRRLKPYAPRDYHVSGTSFDEIR